MASVAATPKLLWVRTLSGAVATRVDPRGADHVLAPASSDEELGAAVLDALARSRYVGTDTELGVEIERVRKHNEERLLELAPQFGYKNARAVLRSMKFCPVVVMGKEILFRPTRHTGLEHWRYLPEEFVVRLASPAGEREVGRATRLALSRCTE